MNVEAYADPEYLALMESVLANPDDDAPKLILSDWLEENGEEEYAKFIRAQIKVDRWNCTFAQTPEQPGWKHNCGTDDKGFWLCQPIRSKCHEAFEKNKCRWFGESWAILYLDSEKEDADGQFEGSNKAFVSRGFISEVHLACEQFCGGPCRRCDGRGYNALIFDDETISGKCDGCGGTGHTEGVARELFERHPITRVVLVDKRPRNHTSIRIGLANSFDWWLNGAKVVDPESDIPKEIFALMSNYKDDPFVEFATEADAIDALSADCVSYARNLVGLDPLRPKQ